MQNFRHSSFRLSPNVYFDKLLLLKVYKISAKKVQRSYASWPWRVMQNLKKNRLLISKMTRISVILIRALKSLTNLHFDWSLLYKVFNIWLKKVQKSYISRHWRVEKFDLWFGKWHEEFGRFSPQYFEVSKLGLWWDIFV